MEHLHVASAQVNGLGLRQLPVAYKLYQGSIPQLDFMFTLPGTERIFTRTAFFKLLQEEMEYLPPHLF
jgi:hypothetical protein